MTKELYELYADNKPLPKGTRIKTTVGGHHTGGDHELSKDVLASANRKINGYVPFWIIGWKNLHDDIILPKKAECPGPTHYAGCACHEKGWKNKWKCAVEMAAQAMVDRDTWKANHDNQVELKRIIAARPDMKERAPMVEKLMSERNRAQGWSTLQHEKIKRMEKELSEAWHLLNVLSANMMDDGPTWPRVIEWLNRNEKKP